MEKPHIYDRGDIVAQAAVAIETILREAINTRSRASLMVSGGRSPKPLYERLSKADLDWSKVTISLVDERWVSSGQIGSNEDFIRQTLIQNKAAQANFFGLKTAHDSVEAGLPEAESRFQSMQLPFDICVMGMGSDAHTASWFPKSQGLSEALATDNPKTLCAINAYGAPVAGDHPHRISLTLQAVLAAHAIFLFIPGPEKRTVFNQVPQNLLLDAPVQALLSAESKLHVFASPTP